VVVRVEVVSRLVQPFETPAIQLARERFVLALDEVFGHYLTHEEVFIVDLPCAAVWHPRDDMRIFMIRKNLVQLGWEVVCSLVSWRNFA